MPKAEGNEKSTGKGIPPVMKHYRKETFAHLSVPSFEMQKIELGYFILLVHQRSGNESSIHGTSCQRPASARASLLTLPPTQASWNREGRPCPR